MIRISYDKISSKEQTVRGCLVVSASTLSPVVSHYSSPGLEKGRICLYSSGAGTDWSPCCHSSMNCPWIFISRNTAPAQRPEPVLQQSLGTDQSTKRPLCSRTWALAAHFSSRTPVLALCFSMHPSQVTWLLLPTHTEGIQTSVGKAAVSWRI